MVSYKASISRTCLEDHLLRFLLSNRLITSMACGLSITDRKIRAVFSLQLDDLLTDSVRGSPGIGVLMKQGAITSQCEMTVYV